MSFRGNEAKALATKLGLREGQSRRVACPSCGGNNSFSISRDRGELLWLCFRASCGVRGRAQLDRTAEEIAAALAPLEIDPRPKPFTVPPHWTSIKSDDKALWYADTNHCTYAYENGLADILLDPRDRRVIFLVRYEGHIVDAVGRALDRKVFPKWHRYGSHPAPFIVQPEGGSDTAIIVEDAASACAVAQAGVAGVAILGTSLRPATARIIRDRFSEYVVALDKDASIKAIDMQRQLRVHGKASVLLLERDLKYLNSGEIQGLISNHKGQDNEAKGNPYNDA